MQRYGEELIFKRAREAGKKAADAGDPCRCPYSGRQRRMIREWTAGWQARTAEISSDIDPGVDQATAVQLLQEALRRIEYPLPNYHGGNMQVGGAYWRLARVLNEYLGPMLTSQEGGQHAAFILKTHGEIQRPPGGRAAPSDSGKPQEPKPEAQASIGQGGES